MARSLKEINMNVSVQFQMEWDRSKETILEFKEKYSAFKEHVTGMQIKGLMPRGEVAWKITSKKPAAPSPGEGNTSDRIPVYVIPDRVPVHVGGRMLM